MEAVIAVVALLFLLFVALGVYAIVKVASSAKRGVDHTISQARRTVEDSTLRAKSYVQPGPVGELAQLRLRLRTTMRATQDALHARVAQDESLKESLGLFNRLSTHGHELDGDLKRLESEPDRVTLAERLPELRARTRRITESADALRWAAHDRAHRFSGDDLDSLSAQIDMEAGALRHWTHEPQPPHQKPRPVSAADEQATRERRQGRHPGGSAARWPEPPAADAPGADQTWSDSPSAAPAAGAHNATRPEISPAVRPPTYSWQKKRRPENTT
jgi:hypothetical protein